MKIRFLTGLLVCLVRLLAGCPVSQAQQPAPTTDVLLLTTGAELSGRVLSITPTELTYLPATTPGAPTQADTLQLPAASVFLVRYANGTREVISSLTTPPAPEPPDATPPALRGLSETQRRALGQRDAVRGYRASGPYWGSMGATLYLGPLLGIASTVGISSVAVRPQNLAAPEPPLLADAPYNQGYRQQANRIKRRRAWGGYAVGTGAYLLLLALLLGSAQ